MNAPAADAGPHAPPSSPTADAGPHASPGSPTADAGPHAPPGSPAAERGGRLAFVDRLRGLATIAMIEVHVVNALLAPAYRGGRAFAALDFVNGLVAPSFLFAAGLSLARSFAACAPPLPAGAAAPPSLAKAAPPSLAKAAPPAAPWPAAPWPAAAARRRLAAGQMRRAALLLAVGYAMHASHLPAALAGRDAGAWAQALQGDVLQLIALSLAALALAAVAAATARRYALGALGAALACAWLGPAAHRYGWGGWPMPLATLLTGRFGSPFPALPWASFVALGAALGAAGPALGAAGPALAAAWARRLGAAGGGALALAALAAAAPWPAGGADEPWALAPASIALRAGLVCLLAAALAFARDVGPRVEGALALFGRHSLFAYVAHIVLVYGRHPLSLRSLIGPTLGPLACAAVWAAVSALMALGALGLRARQARRARARRAPMPPTPRRAP